MKPRISWRELALATGLGFLLAVYAWYTMLGAYPLTQQGDGQNFQKMIEAARVSVVRYHEWPSWNPYECGGIPLWDNPEAPVAAPQLWLMLLTGSTAAIYFFYVFHGAIGFAGMWAFARMELGATRAAALLGGAIWAFCGFHQQQYSGGHIPFCSFEYFPLALLLWRRAERDLRFAVGLGLLVALMFLEASTYPLPHLFLILAAETLTSAWPPRRVLSIARAAGVTGAVALVVGAVRALPVYAQIRLHPRHLTDLDALKWPTLVDMFLARNHPWQVEGQQYVWPEFGAYLGPLVLFLCLVGLVVAGRRYAWLYALLALSFVLMAGHFGRFAPWSILTGHVFPFRDMRVPSRFRCEVSLFLACFAAIGVDRVPALLARWFPGDRARRSIRAGMLVTGLVGFGDMTSVMLSWIQTRFSVPARAEVAPWPRLHLGGRGMAALIDQPAQNRGRRACWSEWGSYEDVAGLWEGDVPQARMLDGQGVVEVANRTQNTFTVDVRLEAPSRVLVNSTYDANWRTDRGSAIAVDRQLALELPAGRYRVNLLYRPRHFAIGLTLSLLGLGGAVAFFVRDARARRRALTSRPPDPRP